MGLIYRFDSAYSPETIKNILQATSYKYDRF